VARLCQGTFTVEVLMKYRDIEDAFEFVSAHGQYEASAFVSRETGETCWVSDNIEEEDLPEDLYESEDYVEIPHKNDLDLGRNLVFRFVSVRAPDHTEEVRRIFSRSGAYGRFKGLLERIHLLEEWYRFEAQETELALREWCGDQGFDLED
jgi:hypothetical protein